jgi:hypothetical protein
MATFLSTLVTLLEALIVAVAYSICDLRPDASRPILCPVDGPFDRLTARPIA